MSNIKLSYMYRDYANYRNHGEVIFSNHNNLSIEEISSTIHANLIDGEWFYASKWEVPDLHFDKYDDEIDHAFHTYESLEGTADAVSDDRTISDFMNQVSGIGPSY